MHDLCWPRLQKAQGKLREAEPLYRESPPVRRRRDAAATRNPSSTIISKNNLVARLLQARALAATPRTPAAKLVVQVLQ